MGELWAHSPNGRDMQHRLADHLRCRAAQLLHLLADGPSSEPLAGRGHLGDGGFHLVGEPSQELVRAVRIPGEVHGFRITRSQLGVMPETPNPGYLLAVLPDPASCNRPPVDTIIAEPPRPARAA